MRKVDVFEVAALARAAGGGRGAGAEQYREGRIASRKLLSMFRRRARAPPGTKKINLRAWAATKIPQPRSEKF